MLIPLPFKTSQYIYIFYLQHAGLSKKTRELKFQQFRIGFSRVLITTDLLTLGMDFKHVSLIINFDLPLERESYIHRYAHVYQSSTDAVDKLGWKLFCYLIFKKIFRLDLDYVDHLDEREQLSALWCQETTETTRK